MLTFTFLTNCFAITASAQALTSSLANLAPLTTASSLNAVAAGDKGTGNRAVRKQAIASIPWQQLSQEQQTIVQHVVSKPTLYRRMPTRIVDCDPELYSLLLDHPELVVDAWGVMGISNLQLEKVGPKLYKMTDSTGTVGQVEVLHSDQLTTTGVSETGPQEGKVSRLLLYAQGVYDAPPMPRPIRANCVLLLTSVATTEANGRTYIKTELDSFIRLDQAAANLLLKAINPIVSKTADHNFVETMRFVSLFSRTAETNPDGMERLASHFTKVEVSTRDEFVTVCHATAQRSAARQQLRTASRNSNVRHATAQQPTSVRYR